MCYSTAPKFSIRYFGLRASGFNLGKRPRGRAETTRGVNSSAKTDGLNCIFGKPSDWCVTTSATRVPLTNRICENLECWTSAAIPDFPTTLLPPFTTLLMTLVGLTTSCLLQQRFCAKLRQERLLTRLSKTSGRRLATSATCVSVNSCTSDSGRETMVKLSPLQ